MRISGRKIGLAALGLAGLLALSACDSVQGARLFTPTSTKYDGAWIGLMTLGLRQPECRLRRGGLRIRIEGGQMKGQARFDTTAGEFEGVVDEDGTIRYATLTGQYAKDDVEFTGTFGEDSAKGVWQNKVCRGEWSLKKAR
ncbi:MAG: hypothetical protein R8L07_16505 [Alphaproteobacteria bacterium]|nr:hypothetical protein [Alphaproteobacteria bacterium]